MIQRILVLIPVVVSSLAAQPSDLSDGIALFNRRRWGEAHAFFANAAKARPRSADAAMWLGKTLVAETKASEAEEWLAKAAALNPQSSEIQLWLARAIGLQAQRATVLRQPFLARRLKAAVDRAITLDPDNVDARELRWQFYSMAPAIMGGGDDHARAEAAEILKRNRYRGEMLSLYASVRKNDRAAIERTATGLIGAFPDSLAPRTAYASWLADHGQATEAFRVIDAFQARHPADPIALFYIGRIADASGQQLDRGEDALRRYIAAAPSPAPNIPSQASAHVRLGNIAAKRGSKTDAKEEYEKALRLDPANAQARRALEGLR